MGCGKWRPAHAQPTSFGIEESDVDKRLERTAGRKRLTAPHSQRPDSAGRMETRATRRGGGAGGSWGAAGAGESGGAVAAGGIRSLGCRSIQKTMPTRTAPASCSAPCSRSGAVKHVLSRLYPTDPTDCTLLARVAKPWLAVVVANNLPRAGKGGAVPLKIEDFLGSVERLAWAKDNGCRWDENVCALLAARGQLDVLKWARELGCPWEDVPSILEDPELAYVDCCACAAAGGHLDVLKWLRNEGCPWSKVTCYEAARCGQKDVLEWAMDNDCPWDVRMCTYFASDGGYPELAQWVSKRARDQREFNARLAHEQPQRYMAFTYVPSDDDESDDDESNGDDGSSDDDDVDLQGLGDDDDNGDDDSGGDEDESDSGDHDENP